MKRIISTIAMMLATACGGEGWEDPETEKVEFGTLALPLVPEQGGGAEFPSNYGLVHPQRADVDECYAGGDTNCKGGMCTQGTVCMYPAYKTRHIRIGTPSNYYPFNDWEDHIKLGVNFAKNHLNNLGWDIQVTYGTKSEALDCPNLYSNGSDFCRHQAVITYDGYRSPIVGAPQYPPDPDIMIPYTLDGDPNETFMDVTMSDGAWSPDVGISAASATAPSYKHRLMYGFRARIYDGEIWNDHPELSEEFRSYAISRAAARAVFAACGFGATSSTGPNLVDWELSSSSDPLYGWYTWYGAIDFPYNDSFVEDIELRD